MCVCVCVCVCACVCVRVWPTVLVSHRETVLSAEHVASVLE